MASDDVQKRFYFAGVFETVEIEELTKMILALKGKVVETSTQERGSFLERSTHCLIKCPKKWSKNNSWEYILTLTPKPLAFMASGKLVLSPDYIKESFKKGRFLEDVQLYMPKPSYNAYKFVNEVNKGPMFQDWRVTLMVHNDEKKYLDFYTLLKAGGATILPLTTRQFRTIDSQHLLNNLDFIFTEPALQQDPNFKMFMTSRARLKWPIKVLSFYYIVQVIRNPCLENRASLTHQFRLENSNVIELLHPSTNAKRKKGLPLRHPRLKKPKASEVVTLDDSDDDDSPSDIQIVRETIVLVNKKIHRRIKEEPKEPEPQQEVVCLDMSSDEESPGKTKSNDWVTNVDSGTDSDHESDNECQIMSISKPRESVSLKKAKPIDVICISDDEEDVLVATDDYIPSIIEISDDVQFQSSPPQAVSSSDLVAEESVIVTDESEVPDHMVITSTTSPQIGSIHSDTDTTDQEDTPGRPVSCISPNQAVREEEIIPEIPVVQVTEKASPQIFANANVEISANSSIEHPTTEKIVPGVEEDERSPIPKAKESDGIQPSLVADVPKTSTKKDTLTKMLAKQRCCVVDLNETETLKQVIGTLLRRQKDHNDCLDFENIRQKTIRFDAKGDMKNSARAISKQAIQMDVFSDSTSFSMLKSKEIENDAVFLVMLRILGFVNLQTYPRAKSMNYLLINLILRPEPKPNLDSELAAELAFDLFIRVLHQHAPTSSIARKYYLSIFRWSHDEDYGQHFEGDLSFWKFFCDIWSDYFSTEPSGQPLLALQIILTCLQRDFEYWLKHGHGSKLVESKPMIFFLFVKDTNIEIHLLDFLHQFDTKIYSDPKVWKLYWRFIAMIALMVAVRDRDTKLTFLHRREALKYKIAHCLSLSFTKVRLEPRKEYTHLSLLRPSWLSHLVTSNLIQLRLVCSSGSTASNSSGSHDDNELPRRDFQFELLVRKKTLNYSLVSQAPEEHQRLFRANIALDKFLATFHPQTIHLSWFMQQTKRHSQNPCRWMKHKSKPMDGEVIKWDSHVHDDLSSLLEKLTIINKVHEELERKNPTQTSDDVSKLTVFSNKLLFLAKD